MSESPKFKVDKTNFTAPLMELQKGRERVEKVAQSVDSSESLADAAIIAGLLKSSLAQQEP